MEHAPAPLGPAHKTKQRVSQIQSKARKRGLTGVAELAQACHTHQQEQHAVSARPPATRFHATATHMQASADSHPETALVPVVVVVRVESQSVQAPLPTPFLNVATALHGETSENQARRSETETSPSQRKREQRTRRCRRGLRAATSNDTSEACVRIRNDWPTRDRSG